MKIDVVVPVELGGSEIQRWRQLQAGSEELKNPFLSSEFAIRVGDVRPSARVAILWDGPEIAGFYPFDQGRFRTGRPFAPGLVDCRAVIVQPGFEWDSRDLLVGCGLDVLEFDHHLAEQGAFADYYVTRSPSPVIDVSGGYEAYLEDRRTGSKKRISSLLRKFRKLEREVGELHFEFECGDPKVLEVLKRWKSEQYRRNTRVDRFSRAWIARLVAELHETHEPDCSATLSVLYAGGEPIAADFALRSTSIVASWFPGFNPEFGHYSPGFLMFLKMAEAAAGRSCTRIDLGKGDETYKSVLGNQAVEVAEGWMERPSAGAWARRAQRIPSRYVVDFVLNRPALRRCARATLLHVGSLRVPGSPSFSDRPVTLGAHAVPGVAHSPPVPGRGG